MKTKQLLTDWKEVELKDLEIDNFKGVNSNKGENGEYFFIPSGAVFPSRIKKDRCWKVKKEDFDKIKEDYHLIEGDVLFNTGGVGTLGRSGFFKEKDFESSCVPDAFILVLRNKDNRLSSKYLFYWLQTSFIKKSIIKNIIGSTGITSIRRKDILDFKIPLPPLSLQKKIVSILEKAEKLKQKREQVDKLMDDYLKSVFNEMFLKRDFSEGEINDLILKTENRNPAKEFHKNYFEYIDIASIDNEIKKIISTKQILGEYAPSRAKQLVKYGDLLVSTVRPNLNAVALVPEKLDNQICSTGFCILRANNKKALSEYLFFISQSQFFVNSLVEKCKGANYPAVSNKDITSLKIPLPPLPLQKKFSKIVENIEKIKETQKKI